MHAIACIMLLLLSSCCSSFGECIADTNVLMHAPEHMPMEILADRVIINNIS